MNLKFIGFVPCLLTMTILFIVGTTAYADSDRSRSGSFEKRVAGTYLVREAPEETDIFLRLITLTADGNWFSIDAQQQNFGFTDQQGVWKKSGRREITANVIDFDISPGGLPTGIARIRFVMKFSKNLRHVTGSFLGEVFDLHQNPLDPNEVPRGEPFQSTLKGNRVTVDFGEDD